VVGVVGFYGFYGQTASALATARPSASTGWEADDGRDPRYIRVDDRGALVSASTGVSGALCRGCEPG
jgi:hypothetical protein